MRELDVPLVTIGGPTDGGHMLRERRALQSTKISRSIPVGCTRVEGPKRRSTHLTDDRAALDDERSGKKDAQCSFRRDDEGQSANSYGI